MRKFNAKTVFEYLLFVVIPDSIRDFNSESGRGRDFRLSGQGRGGHKSALVGG